MSETWNGMQGEIVNWESGYGNVRCFIPTTGGGTRPVGDDAPPDDGCIHPIVGGDNRGDIDSNSSHRLLGEDWVVSPGMRVDLSNTPGVNLSPSSTSSTTTPQPPSSIFKCSNFLNEVECKNFINAAKPHFKSLDGIFPQEHRTGSRALLRLPPVDTQEMFRRSLLLLRRQEVQDQHPMCFGHGGVWYPLTVNSCVKVTKGVSSREKDADGGSSVARCAHENGVFARHRDGPWIPREDQASIFTVLVYLTDVNNGGETVLFPECDAAGCEMMPESGPVHLRGPELRDPRQSAAPLRIFENNVKGEDAIGRNTSGDKPTSSSSAAAAAKSTSSASVVASSSSASTSLVSSSLCSHKRILQQPVTGTALFFPHHIPHGAILRTEIIYRRVAPLLRTSIDHYLTLPGYAETRSLYEDSQRALLEGDTVAFVGKYHQVVERQRKAMLMTPVPPSPADDIIINGSNADADMEKKMNKNSILGPINCADVVELIMMFLGPQFVASSLLTVNERLYFFIIRNGWFWKKQMNIVFPFQYNQAISNLRKYISQGTEDNGVTGEDDSVVGDTHYFRASEGGSTTPSLTSSGPTPQEQLVDDDVTLEETIAWFDAFQRQAILSRVLHPTILTVHSHFIAAKRCHRALYAPTPASPQIPASHGAAPSASRLVINEYTQQLDPAKEMLKNVGSGHNWDSDVATCIVDIDNNQVPSSRLPEDGASVYHFHVQDADRFVKIATNGTHGAPKDFNHPFDVIVEPVVGDEQNNYAIAWGPLGRALSELSTIQPPPPPNPTTTSNHNGSSAASNIAAKKMPTGRGNLLGVPQCRSPPPLLVLTHPLTIGAPTRAELFASAKELFVCGGVSQVAFLHPAVAALKRVATSKPLSDTTTNVYHQPSIPVPTSGLVAIVTATLDVHELDDSTYRTWWWSTATYICIVRNGIVVDASTIENSNVRDVAQRLMNQERRNRRGTTTIKPLPNEGSPLGEDFTVALSVYVTQNNPDWNSPVNSEDVRCDMSKGSDDSLALQREYKQAVQGLKTLMSTSHCDHPVSIVNTYDAATAYGESSEYRKDCFYQV